MFVQSYRIPSGPRRWRPMILAVATFGLIAGSVPALASGALAASPLPCDIYGNAGTSCEAAYSSVRALYDTYGGSLYQVTRASDNTTYNVGLLATGGYVNAPGQDSFCSGTTCRSRKSTISRPTTTI